ncbi:hypothetical protein BDN70DRAFT_276194 [Pholiota conissans]|uniref:F-box domain-containing protein n=1 Tax=Pholiota conissans TaxID=109636 RepID=A0A9P5ZA41_9AGAR|nr:hypothetical protein BDN70DRAFT_276194 [Pholiota conissans]
MTSFAGYDFLTRGVEVPWLPSHYHEITHEKANQIAHIDAEVMRSNDDILKILNRRASLNRMRNSFVPAVNLPAELLATIFEWACCSNDVEPNVFDEECLPQDVKPEDEAKLLQESYTDTCAEIRLAIGRVCSVWRSVALDTPQLWSNITLPVDEEDADDQAEKLQYILSKSGQRPLSVRLVELIAEYDPHKDIDEPLGGIPSTVIDTLEMQAHRLRALNIILPVTWEPALNRMANRMSLLVRITLHIPHDSDTFYPVECFASAPRLREVILMRYNISSVVLPWGQLERLEGKCSGLLKCLDILRRCPRLRHCSIKLNDHDYLNVKVLAPLTHTKLESLKLFMDCSPDDFAAFFDALTLPMLRSLEIDYFQMTPLFTFFVRSACRLETLCLKGVIEEDNLIACLQVLPELRELIRGVGSCGRYRVPTRRILDFVKTHNISFQRPY